MEEKTTRKGGASAFEKKNSERNTRKSKREIESG